MNDEVNAMKYFIKLKNTNKHTNVFADCLQQCIKYKLDKKEDRYFHKLKSVYNKIKYNGVVEDKIIILDYIIEYCEQHQIIEEEYKYQKELLNIYKNIH